MIFNIDDIVSRNSYNNDTMFQIININGDNVILKGVNIRLYADSDIKDLKLEDNNSIIDDEEYVNRTCESFNLDRSEYFYLPGKILHIDAVYFDN